MIDFDEISRRAKEAQERTSAALAETMEKSARLAKESAERAAAREAEAMARKAEQEEHEAAQTAANAQRQVEILGQVFSADSMAQMASNEEYIKKIVSEKVAEASALSVEGLMSQMFGEDMGVIAAALETLAMEEDGEEEESGFGPEEEESLYILLEETMARLEAMPEPEPVPYGKDAAKWERFGILLSGIVSTLNSHSLDEMDVEDHTPVLEQQVVSIVRRSWGINGRSDLLEMIRYLTREGYTLRYQVYSEAESPEELLDEDEEDAEERENVARAWRFAQRYKDRYAPGFMAGWDIGRGAMLTRWGCYLGWITESEAVGILWELSQKAAEELHSWREFAQSYLFGGLMWKLLCGDSSAASYLGYIADAAADLIAGEAAQGHGQWKNFPWPAQRKIGFTH
jgi:hypothetical protein